MCGSSLERVPAACRAPDGVAARWTALQGKNVDADACAELLRRQLHRRLDLDPAQLMRGARFGAARLGARVGRECLCDRA